jgi:hypothetical protein
MQPVGAAAISVPADYNQAQRHVRAAHPCAPQALEPIIVKTVYLFRVPLRITCVQRMISALVPPGAPGRSASRGLPARGACA